MTDLDVFYPQQTNSTCYVQPWLNQLQQTAQLAFAQFGLPDQSMEDWKYTPVPSVPWKSFKQSSSRDKVRERAQQLPIADCVMLHNGCQASSPGINWPQGMVVSTLQTAIATHPELVRAYLGSILRSQHGLQALNTMMLREGMFIYVPKHVLVEQPICLSHWQSGDEEAAYIRHLLVLDEGSQLTVIEDYAGRVDGVYATNTITEVHLAANADLCHYKLQRESRKSYHFGHIAVRQNQGSRYANHALSIGGQWVRSDLSVYLQQPQASCLMNAVYATVANQHVDHHTQVEHQSAQCESIQDYKGIITGHSKAVFNGRVHVLPHAQQTVAKQQNKNLLLSRHAAIDTKPELNIFADDVVCTHGATVGQLDEDALFYLASRGIEREQASMYLLNGFAVDNFRYMHNHALSEWMNGLFTDHLRGLV